MRFMSVAVASLTALTLGALPAAAQFSASPAMVWAEASADGAPATATISIRNEGAEQSQIRVYVADFDQTVDGENEFFDAGTQLGSCGARLRVTPDVAVLGAGEGQELRVELDDATEPCWAVVFVQNSGTDVSGIRVGQRIGVKVYAGDRSAKALDGAITTVEAVPSADGVTVDFEFVNSSGSPVRPSGQVELRSLDGAAVAQVAIDAFSVLPGHTRRISATVPASLEAGRYVAVPVIDFGGEFLAGGQGLFRIQ